MWRPTHAVFVTSLIHVLDVLAQLPEVDPTRIGAVGFSGGGWQALWLGAVDTRVSWVNVMAGGAAYRERATLRQAMGDSEQTASDLYTALDYTDLVALLAPRPTLLTYNSDDEWFPAAPCLETLVSGAAPHFDALDSSDRLHTHVSTGTHVMRRDAFEALFRFINDEGLAAEPVSESASHVDDELLDEATLTAPLAAGVTTLNDLAQRACADLPVDASLPEDNVLPAWALVRRAALNDVLRTAVDVSVTPAGFGVTTGGAHVRATHGLVGGVGFSALLVHPPSAERLVVLLDDAGRAGALARALEIIDVGDAVLFVSPPHVGDARTDHQAWLDALLEQGIGLRPLGLQARALLEVSAQSALATGLPLTLEADGARTSTIALVAAALEPQLFQALGLQRPLESLHDLVDNDLGFVQLPELFARDLLVEFDLPQLVALAAPTPIEVASPAIASAWAEALALGR